eukprot:TRINITY_DN78073_c0_g1_i1.p1 TRINITY_DN78073_c0_g1~~TRINITY_DN78073_c0_g1_i1.p1  ORF type:complete len:185 (-),score=19.98 TRINITY_DN78073_c0_g1_i1:101-655(-)
MPNKPKSRTNKQTTNTLASTTKSIITQYHAATNQAQTPLQTIGDIITGTSVNSKSITLGSSMDNALAQLQKLIDHLSEELALQLVDVLVQAKQDVTQASDANEKTLRQNIVGSLEAIHHAMVSDLLSKRAVLTDIVETHKAKECLDNIKLTFYMNNFIHSPYMQDPVLNPHLQALRTDTLLLTE